MQLVSTVVSHGVTTLLPTAETHASAKEDFLCLAGGEIIPLPHGKAKSLPRPMGKAKHRAKQLTTTLQNGND